MKTKIYLPELKKREESILSYLKKNNNIYFAVNLYNQVEIEYSLALNYFLDKREVKSVFDYDSERTHPFFNFEETYSFYKNEYGYDFDVIDLREKLIDCVRYFIADEYSAKGFSHKSVLWALHNCNDPSWFSEILQETYDEKSFFNEYLQQRLEKFKLKKRITNFLKESPEYANYRKVTFSNYAGDHGYIDYDLVNMKVEVRDVICYSSHMFGGNCNCVNHDPLEEYTTDLCESDFEKIKSIAEKEHFDTLLRNI